MSQFLRVQEIEFNDFSELFDVNFCVAWDWYVVDLQIANYLHRKIEGPKVVYASFEEYLD